MTLDLTMTVEQCWQPVPGGSATYLLELLRALDATAVKAVGLAAAHRRPAPAGLQPPVPVRQVPLPRRVLYELWNRVPGPLAEWTTPGSDVVHATTWAVPRTRRPLVVTVHDLAFVHEPAHFTPHGVQYFERALARTIDEATAVVVPSQATADDCVAAGVETSRLSVVPHGAPRWAVSDEEAAAFVRARGLPERFVLWVGTHEPRKNLSGLLQAFSALSAEDPDLHLVLVGPPGWGRTASIPTGPWTSRVHELGYLPLDELPLAYAAASAFVFPSHREGFGLPVLEAMTVGTPVVTSRATAMAEIAGEAGVLVDPSDPMDIAAGIARALSSAQRLGAAARQRAAGFTWRASAEAHLAVYRSAAEG
ncbi:glycosyltransferase family 4 protein [Actinotalea sp. M2MS4P-6]|uniref:glycosyltransferase family 4 protein n=1 Tax=Actinotalea sp. M2MS4P-6 TaxID=2983762 RepID=UPI0021E478CA|nr:glycosyltransferase family 1 protein [Actinotalea sp. M2MS4P-6]MCV2394178.1 glycosyltransferase family 4 protein [Actinotalea sp. M2MS4P-6]